VFYHGFEIHFLNLIMYVSAQFISEHKFFENRVKISFAAYLADIFNPHRTVFTRS